MSKKVYVVVCTHQMEGGDVPAFRILGVFATRETAEESLAVKRDEILNDWKGHHYEIDTDVPGYFSIYDPHSVDADDVYIEEHTII